MLAHELRNPLGPILTNLHILRLIGGDADGLEKAAHHHWNAKYVTWPAW